MKKQYKKGELDEDYVKNKRGRGKLKFPSKDFIDSY